MNRALIIHHSRTGTTAAFGEAIAAELKGKGIESQILPMYKAISEPLIDADTLFLGCWTNGLFFFLQKTGKGLGGIHDPASHLEIQGDRFVHDV